MVNSVSTDGLVTEAAGSGQASMTESMRTTSPQKMTIAILTGILHLASNNLSASTAMEIWEVQ